ncbi:MAG: N-acetyltransferase [Nitrospirae bacterium]|nr:N-acetyltransferase [Nitrospirota bacterium]
MPESTSNGIEVLPAVDKKSFKEFLNLPFKLYAGEPFWVPPLLKDLKTQFSPQNPFFRHAEAVPFIARINGSTAGRITAIYNKAHMDFHGEQAGFFGFFECIDSYPIASALIERVKHWLREKGMLLMRGPMNFSSNEECGLLIEGYNSSPVIMMPYNFSYYRRLLEQCGLTKAKDLFAYLIDVPDALPEKVCRAADIAKKHNINVRPINIKSFKKEMEVFKNIYNSAWEKNWGFVPMTEEEIDYTAEKLKTIIDPELTLIALCNDEPVGFMMLLPDFNYVLKKLNGRLSPLGILKALWHSRKITDARLPLLGIKESYRRQGVDALLILEGFKAIKKKGYKHVEFSWILEDNYPVQRIIEIFSGRLYKRYRIYETKI